MPKGPSGQPRWRARAAGTRTLVLPTLAVGLGWLALVAIDDRTTGSAAVKASDPLDAPFFENFSSLQSGGFRVASLASRLVIPGLWTRTPVSVSLAMASALAKAQVVSIHVSGTLVHRQDVGGRPGVVEFAARTDERGRLSLQWVSDSPSSSVSVYWVRVEGKASAGFSTWRSLQWVGFLLVCASVGIWWGRSAAASAITVAAGAAALGLGIASSRVVVLAYLPAVMAALALCLLLAAFATMGLHFPRGDAAWVAAAFGLRLLLAAHPYFPAIDLTLHAHRLWTYKEGGLVTNVVGDPSGPGVLIGPYPPALYAAVAPFVRRGDPGEGALRLAMALLEGTAPLLVFALMRTGGASTRAAAAASVAAAVMPEGMLVLAKGVAANIAGSWLGLWVVLSILRGAPGPLVGALASLAFLGHAGSAVALGGLLVLWIGFAAATRVLSPSAGLRTLGWVALGAGLAWLAYYREVAAIATVSLSTVGRGMAANPAGFFQVRWVHVGKILQNLFLKFGGGPIVLAWFGVRRARVPPPLACLLAAWLAFGVALAVLAVVTPFSIRFEYFLSPAVAMAAGLGAESCSEGKHDRFVQLAWLASALLQVGLGGANLLGRFDPISVIIPSPRWPMPVS